MACTVPDSEITQATSKTRNLGPATTLHRGVSEFQLDEEIAEAEASAQSECETDTDDDQTDNERGYSPDIRQLVQAKIAWLGVPSSAKIQ